MNKFIVFLVGLSVVGQITLAGDQMDRIEITGKLPSWKMHMTSQGVVSSPLNSAYENEAARSSRAGHNSSATIGALFIASTGIGLLGQLAGASYESDHGSSDPSFNDSWGGWQDLTSKRSAGNSTLDTDIKRYEAGLAAKLNEELQNTEDGSGGAFITSKGYVQKVTLDSNGIMMNFTTSLGYYFERQDKKGAVYFIGIDASESTKVKIKLFVNSN